MPITEKQLEDRFHYLGASDIPAIFGQSRFATPWDIWASKTGKVEPGPVNAAMSLGTRMEVGVLDHVAETRGAIIRNQFRSARSRGLPMAAHCDAVMADTDQPIEVKCEGLFGPLRPGWGDAGTDSIPHDVCLQLYAQMICCEVEGGYVSALLGGRGIVDFVINWDAELADCIKETACSFWADYVATDTPPPTTPTLDITKRLIKVPGKITIIDTDTVAHWRECNAIKLAAQKDAKAAEAAVRAALLDAEAGDCEIGRVTVQTIERKGYTVEPSSYTQLKYKEGMENGTSE